MSTKSPITTHILDLGSGQPAAGEDVKTNRTCSTRTHVAWEAVRDWSSR